MMKKTVTAVLLLAMLAATGCASSDITVGTGSWDGKEGTTAEKSEAASELTDVTTKVFTNSIGTVWVVGIATVKNPVIPTKQRKPLIKPIGGFFLYSCGFSGIKFYISLYHLTLIFMIF